MNRGQLKTRVARMAGMTIGSSDDVIDETQLLEELANEAVLDILARTKVHVRRAEVVLTTGISEFDLDASILRVWNIVRGTEELTEQPLHSLDSNGYAFAGYNRLVVGQAGTGETAILDYTPRPTAMTTDADDPSSQAFGNIPKEHHIAIVNYMLWHASDKAGDAQVQRGERYRAMYEGQDGMAGPGTNLGRIKAAINQRGGSVQVRRHREVLAGDRDPSFWQG